MVLLFCLFIHNEVPTQIYIYIYIWCPLAHCLYTHCSTESAFIYESKCVAFWASLEWIMSGGLSEFPYCASKFLCVCRNCVLICPVIIQFLMYCIFYVWIRVALPTAARSDCSHYFDNLHCMAQKCISITTVLFLIHFRKRLSIFVYIVQYEYKIIY